MIYESVIITQNEDGTNQIAPLGYQEKDGLIMLAPFYPSTTLSNLRRSHQAVINLTDNVAVIAGCLTNRRDWPTVKVQHVEGVRLRDTLSHLELKVERIEEDEQRPKFFCKIVHQETHKPFKGFNRAQSAVLEAAILVSRLHMLTDEKVEKEVEYLRIAIQKTAGQQELEAWNWLMERIEQFRDQ